MITTLIFDLDGTLVDSLEDLANTTNLLLQEDNLPLHTLTKYQQFIGNGVDKLLQRALPDDKKNEVKAYRQRFDKYYKQKCLEHTKPYPQMFELITYLKENNYKLAVVTNKPHEMAVKIVKTLFPDCFAYIFGNTSYQPKKPHPCLTNLARQLLDSKKEETLYIGDSNVDMETAKNAGLKAVGCLWGFRDEQELKQAGADYLVSNPWQIKELLS